MHIYKAYNAQSIESIKGPMTESRDLQRAQEGPRKDPGLGESKAYTMSGAFFFKTTKLCTKEGDSVIADTMDVPGGHYSK